MTALDGISVRSVTLSNGSSFAITGVPDLTRGWPTEGKKLVFAALFSLNCPP